MPAFDTRDRTKRILLVDDHAFTSLGAKGFLERQPDLEVVATATSSAETFAALEQTEVDVAIVDLSLGSEDGLDLVKQLAARHPALRLLVLSMHDEVIYAGRSLRAGALGYGMKGDDSDVLLEAIRRVHRGEIHLSERARETALRECGGSDGPATPAELLSDRELTVFRSLGQGLSTREIAESLQLSPKTVQTYRERIKTKLGLHSGTELVHRAVHFARTPSGGED